MCKKIKGILVLFLCSGLFIFSQTTVKAQEEWKREIFFGYNQSSGNTKNAELSVGGEIKKIMLEAEFLANGDIYYSSTNNQMDAQRWASLARYFYNFGEEKIWFNSYQILVDHDRFADIHYRILPSTGIGYWFSKEEDWKAMVEGSLGYELTNYRSNKSDEEEPVLIGRTFLEKKVFDNARISEDFSVIPSLEGNGARIKSETAFTNPISEGLDLSIKFIVDHDTEPPAGIKKTDTRLITALKHSF